MKSEYKNIFRTTNPNNLILSTFKYTLSILSIPIIINKTHN